jgi:hypothetical protein
MVSRHWVLSLLLMLITFILGFYIANYIEQLSLTNSSANFLGIILALGTFFSVLNIIKDWITDNRNTPVLEYGEIVKRDMKYYLRIKKVKGEHQAKSVRGFVTIDNTNINNIPTIWDFENDLSISIGHFRDIHLFTYNVPAIFFPIMNHDVKHWYKTTIIQFETTNKISIRIESENAKVPKEPFSKSFDDIKSNIVIK